METFHGFVYGLWLVVFVIMAIMAMWFAFAFIYNYIATCRWYWGVCMGQRREWRAATFAERRDTIRRSMPKRGRRNRWLKRNQWALPVVIAWAVAGIMFRGK